jgi:hypothetical protein
MTFSLPSGVASILWEISSFARLEVSRMNNRAALCHDRMTPALSCYSFTRPVHLFFASISASKSISLQAGGMSPNVTQPAAVPAMFAQQAPMNPFAFPMNESPAWHAVVAHIQDVNFPIRKRCQHGFGLLMMCYKTLVLLQPMGIYLKQRGQVAIPVGNGQTQIVDANTLLTHIGINFHAFWNHRGHARSIPGRRRDLLAQKEQGRLNPQLALVLWLLDLLMDSTLPPDEMDVAGSVEFATLIRSLLYQVGIKGVVGYLGLKRKRVVVKMKKTRKIRVSAPWYVRAH